MKTTAAAMGLALMAGMAAAQSRPAITGISHMCLYSGDAAASDHFYGHILGAAKAEDPFDAKGVRYYFSPAQFVELVPLPGEHSISRMACVAWNTEDAGALRKYLQSRGVEGTSDVRSASDGARWFEVKDPEGNLVRFVQPGNAFTMPADAKPIGTHIIHVGYLVHNRAAEDHFYREILGFRPYWFGAKQPGSVDWISQQVPDGHDWLEYMMVGDGSDVPPSKVDQRQLGVLNHFSIGVPNMEQVVDTLYREDRLSGRYDGPKIGLDSKWQFNYYDPDGTRVELMEFQPVSKPCCSPFTADSPTN